MKQVNGTGVLNKKSTKIERKRKISKKINNNLKND